MTRLGGIIGSIAAIGLGGSAAALPAQSHSGIELMGQAIVAAKRADPIPGGGALTEVRVVQPVLMAIGHAWGDKVGFRLTLDFEGLTIPDGVLTPGAWGEGYVDRRHPHTTFHEAIVSVNDVLGGWDHAGRLNLIAGKGFVPYGTDDPMSRPFLRYPVNHHLSQILERAVGIAQYVAGLVTLEGSLFDGDEPTQPSDWPLIRADGHWRFGDSWSGRVTVRPVAGVEVQGSLAHVHSPEDRYGAAPEADKTSLSARWDHRRGGHEHSAMIEWARSAELGETFTFHTLLGEAMLRQNRVTVSYRFERTERPEEMRLVDLFRTQRPAPEYSLLGISRWTLHTVHVSFDWTPPDRSLIVRPFAEATVGHVARVGAGLFDPIGLYGTDRVRGFAIGVTVGWGMRHHRMGHYGLASAGHMAGMVM